MQTHFPEKLNSDNMDRTANFYSGPSYRYGGGAMPVFSGSRRQRGGSIFGALKRLFWPVITSLGKKIAKRGASEAVGLAGDVVKDAFLSKDVGESLKSNAKRRALDLGKYSADQGLDAMRNMIGSGKRRRKTRTKRQRPVLRKRKTTAKRRKSKPRKKQRRVTAKPLF